MYFCEAGSNQFKKGDNCSTKPVISGEQESGFVFTPNNTLSILNLSISPLGILLIQKDLEIYFVLSLSNEIRQDSWPNIP